MERNDEHLNDDLIDLGAITEETRGPSGIPFDTQGGLQAVGGISDD